jgi:hypothetical protein
MEIKKENFKYKKSKNHSNIMNFNYIFKYIVFFCVIEEFYFNQSFIYSNAIKLVNNNIFIIHKFGIDIYDPTFSEKIKNIITFNDQEQIAMQEDYSKTMISIYNDNEYNEYIICGISGKLYIFDCYGEMIVNSENKIDEIQDKYYSLIAINKTDNEFIYFIGLFNDNYSIQLSFFKYDNNNKNNTKIYNISRLSNIHRYKDSKSNISKTNKFSCQLMKNSSQLNKIVCIYYINENSNKSYLDYFLIDTETYLLSGSNENNNKIIFQNEIRDIKSTINIDNSKMFICLYLISGKIYCLIYYINTNSFSNYTEYIINCNYQYSVLTKFNYIREKEQYVFSCLSDNGFINLINFNNNNEYISNYEINNCNYKNGYSIFFSTENDSFIIISDLLCNQSNNFFELSNNIYIRSLTPTNLRGMQDLTDCEDLIQCETCNQDSLSKRLCLTCKSGYYELDANNSNQNGFINCYNESTKPENVYLNKESNKYESCYFTCSSCEYGGDGIQNNCTKCAMNYMEDPSNPTNCVVKCKYFFYFTTFDQYKCSSTPQCPEEKSLLIREKRKCIESCSLDDNYPFQYSGECLRKCPEEAKEYNENKICQVKDKDLCSKSTSQFDLYDFLKEGGVEKIAKTYAKEFNYTNKHISIFKNEVYSIMLYKSAECITELELPMPEIDFGSCYTKVKGDIESSLIIAIIDKISAKKNNPITSYSLYHPVTGEKLDAETLCKEETIVVKENIKSLLNDSGSDMNSILFLTQQNIDVFNRSSGFFTDLCYHFESPCNKDVALNDRLLVYYPNITLCDSGCINSGVNLTSMTAICECKFKEMTDEESEESINLYQNAVNEFYNFLNKINLGVMACYKDLFDSKYFSSCTGGIIILIIFCIQLIIYIIYYYISFFNVKKYIYTLTDNYLLYLNKSPMYKTFMNKIKIKNDEENEESNTKKSKNDKKNISSGPPKKIAHKDININIFNINNNKQQNMKIKKVENLKKAIPTQEASEDKNSKNSMILRKKKKNNISNNSNIKLDKSLISIKSNDKSTNPLANDNNSKKNLSFFDHYLSTQLNEMIFYDAAKKDNRLFFDYFWDKLKRKQVFLDLLLIDDPIKPKTLKALLLILDIEVCFVINAMFINEEYVSKLFRSTKEETFLSFVPRSINRMVYSIIASLIIAYIVGCLFIEERRLKSIFRYEKSNTYALKYEISLVMKEMKWRYNIFIILTVAASAYSWFYLSCFNNIYPHMKVEWIKSSILIILLLYIIAIIVTLVETLLRFVSFEIKSEKMYKASLWLA